jgi:hypothetical protein
VPATFIVWLRGRRGDDLADHAEREGAVRLDDLAGEVEVAGFLAGDLREVAEPPKSPEKPTLRKAVPNLARSEAMRMSQASARERPAPTAWPLTMAMVTLGMVWRRKLVSR